MNVLPACASSHLSRPLCRRLLPFVKRKKSPRKTLVRTNQKHPRPRLQQQQQIARSRVFKISSTSLPKTTRVCKKKKVPIGKHYCRTAITTTKTTKKEIVPYVLLLPDSHLSSSFSHVMDHLSFGRTTSFLNEIRF